MNRPLNWLPPNDNLVVRPLVPADPVDALVVTPDATRERPMFGLVLAVGPGLRTDEGLVPPTCQPGDLVAFTRFGGMDVTLDGEPVLVLRDTEVLVRKPAGTFELVEHTVPHGLTTRTALHEAGYRCEHCPRDRSALLEDERRRLLAESASGGPDGVP